MIGRRCMLSISMDTEENTRTQPSKYSMANRKETQQQHTRLFTKKKVKTKCKKCVDKVRSIPYNSKCKEELTKERKGKENDDSKRVNGNLKEL